MSGTAGASKAAAPPAVRRGSVMDDNDLWHADCGCVHVLVGLECPCGPSIGEDEEGDFVVHHDPHTDERVCVDAR